MRRIVRTAKIAARPGFEGHRHIDSVDVQMCGPPDAVTAHGSPWWSGEIVSFAVDYDGELIQFDVPADALRVAIEPEGST